MLEACREHGVTLVAYSPLCQGLLSGGAAWRAIGAARSMLDACNQGFPC